MDMFKVNFRMCEGHTHLVYSVLGVVLTVTLGVT